MMKMNTAAWIGIGGGISGFLIAIICVLSVGGQIGIYIALGMLVVFGGVFFLLYKLLIGPMMNTSRLQKNGISSKAIITEVKSTGVYINHSPQVKLILELKNTFGQKYTTTYKTVVSIINPGAYQPGMEVPVKVDPKDEKNVVLDFSRDSSSSVSSSPTINQPAIDVNLLKTELEKLQQEHNAISISGRSARAIIKNYTWLGTYVNGNNPYVELDIEVLPDAGPAFSGKTRGVIAEASIPKYQPGKEIFVKYDLYDNSKIVVEHS